jgi:MFS superfamily sulfate permease-like transporter
MISMSFVLGVCFGMCLGFALFIGLTKLVTKINLKKLQDDYNTFFTEIKELVGSNSFKFINRFNDHLTFRVTTKSLGKVTLIMVMSRRDISIFQKNECIYTTQHADSNLIKSIVDNIESTYDSQIKDCFQIMGNVIDKTSIRRMNPDADFPEAFPKPEMPIFNIDDILDRINEVGIQNLTPEEKEFLQNYQKK